METGEREQYGDRKYALPFVRLVYANIILKVRERFGHGLLPIIADLAARTLALPEDERKLLAALL